jgi:CRISPR-associated helicase Cas3/CRISPR-associated endonuclease Cas3-HD
MDTISPRTVRSLSSSRDILAKTKPQVSLGDHVSSVANETRNILDTSSTRKRIRETDIGFDEFLEIAERVGCYHDVGKAHPDWQKECWEAITQDRVPNFPPHSARSCIYAWKSLYKDGFGLEEVMSASVAVLHHHTPFSRSSMDPDNDIFDTTGVEEMVSNLHKEVDDIGVFSSYFLDVEIDSDTRKKLERNLRALRKGRNSSTWERVDYDKIATVSSLLHSALVQADHYVSATESDRASHRPKRLNQTDVSLRPESELRPFQKRVDEVSSEHLLGLAGCGEGKTHSAFQWGTKRIEEGKADRLVFAMPTQVTTNNLLLSMRDDGIVTNEASSLYHGASQDFLERKSEKEQWDVETLDEEARRWFKKPVTVCTVDHVLSTLVNGYKSANVGRGNLLRGAVVFDEIHAYDGYTTGHILSALRKLEDMKVPWYVMTATMPQQLRQDDAFSSSESLESEGRLGDNQPVRTPFEVSLNEDDLTAEEVLQKSKESESKKTMVVKNTVKSANRLTRELNNKLEQENLEGEVVYYSSEFTQRDRDSKEKEIKQKFGAETNPEKHRFLVSTQVCEISLDLSADILLTDLAPMDAVVQRAGRLHRRGTHSDSKACDCSQCEMHDEHEYDCIVYSTLEEGDTWYPYAEDDESEEWKILEQTQEVFKDSVTYSFSDSLEWVRKAYSGVEFEEMGMRTDKFASAIEEDRFYGKDRNLVEENEDSSLTIRKGNSRRVSVLPCMYRKRNENRRYTPHDLWQQFHECNREKCGVHLEVYNECKEKLRKFLRRNSVPIPVWWLHSEDVEIHTHSLRDDFGEIEEGVVVDVEYYYEYGVIPPESLVEMGSSD